MTAPDISVVMASRNAGPALEECLRSLDAQCFSGSAETVVADCSTDGTDERVLRQFPSIRLLRFAASAAPPQMLRDALREARGKVVAVTDPHCRFPQNWLEKLRRAHDSDFPVIGGAVENGRDGGAVSWACFLADYGAFMPPAERRTTDLLAGNHVSYKRDLLQQCRESLDRGFYKVLFHCDLSRRGVRFLFDPELVVRYTRPDTFWSFLTRYFRHGRAFAAARARSAGWWWRALRIVCTPLLVPLLLERRISPILRRGLHWRELLMSLPMLAIFVTSWSAGELAGNLGCSAGEADLW